MPSCSAYAKEFTECFDVPLSTALVATKPEYRKVSEWRRVFDAVLPTAVVVQASVVRYFSIREYLNAA